MLWQIESPNHEKSILFGTTHLIDQDVFALLSSLDKYISKANVIYIEYDYQNVDNELIYKKLINTGTPISEKLTPNELQRYIVLMKKNHLDLEVFKSASFFETYNLLLNPRMITELPIDFKLIDIAKKNNTPLKGLQPLLPVIDEVLKFDNSYFLLATKALLSDDEDINTKVVLLKSIYFSENLNEILKSIHHQITDTTIASDYIEKVIYSRNKMMFENVSDDLLKGNVFIAVGAAHLGGPKGLLNLLASEGYSLTRLDLS